MLERTFALSKEGAKNLRKGILSSAFAGISLMLPMSILLMLLNELLKPILNKTASSMNIVFYIAASLALLLIIYLLHRLEYHNTYLSAYEESAGRRIALAEKLRQLPLSFFGRHDLAALTTSMMGDCTEVEKTFAQAVPKMFGSLISILLVVIGLFFMEWRLALALFCVLPFAFLLVLGSKRIQDTMGNQKLDTRLIASDGIQEFLETIGQIRACNQTSHYLSGLDQKLKDTIKASLKMEVTTGTFLTSAYMVLRLGFPIVVLTGANLLSNNKIDFLTYLLFLIAASRIYEPLSGVINQIGEIFNSQLQIKRMKEIHDTPSMTGGNSCDNRGFDIHFDRVGFAYETDKSVLEDITFTARQGEITALVGPSGSGKSTIAKLAARFWDVDSGKIFLGGVDIHSVDPEVLLQNFSMVFQDVVLFNDTIMENIRIGRRTATDQEVIAAARQACCAEFIQHLPQAYQTVIGENGVTLSGGERQRLSIARALLKDAPIILLDEATASLDVENETLIQTALSTLIQNKTVLVIAHRMRTIAGADKVIVLENGRISETGSPNQLIRQNGLYRHLVELQQETANWSLNG